MKKFIILLTENSLFSIFASFFANHFLPFPHFRLLKLWKTFCRKTVISVVFPLVQNLNQQVFNIYAPRHSKEAYISKKSTFPCFAPFYVKSSNFAFFMRFGFLPHFLPLQNSYYLPLITIYAELQRLFEPFFTNLTSFVPRRLGLLGFLPFWAALLPE